MEYVELDNIWKLHYIQSHAPKLVQGIVDKQMVLQDENKPLLPEGFNPLTTEYLDIYIARSEGVRLALWLEFKDPSCKRALREQIETLYSDMRMVST